MTFPDSLFKAGYCFPQYEMNPGMRCWRFKNETYRLPNVIPTTEIVKIVPDVKDTIWEHLPTVRIQDVLAKQ